MAPSAVNAGTVSVQVADGTEACLSRVRIETFGIGGVPLETILHDPDPNLPGGAVDLLFPIKFSVGEINRIEFHDLDNDGHRIDELCFGPIEPIAVPSLARPALAVLVLSLLSATAILGALDRRRIDRDHLSA
jgi:hypothetical protein